jgi:hypothetical protein
MNRWQKAIAKEWLILLCTVLLGTGIFYVHFMVKRWQADAREKETHERYERNLSDCVKASLGQWEPEKIPSEEKQIYAAHIRGRWIAAKTVVKNEETGEPVAPSDGEWVTGVEGDTVRILSFCKRLIGDRDFYYLSDEEKVKFLGKIDPAFYGLEHDDKMQVIDALRGNFWRSLAQRVQELDSTAIRESELLKVGEAVHFAKGKLIEDAILDKFKLLSPKYSQWDNRHLSILLHLVPNLDYASFPSEPYHNHEQVNYRSMFMFVLILYVIVLLIRSVVWATKKVLQNA